MPTGYTAKLYDGEQSFDDFVLGCARAFGALVTMREAPADTPIPQKLEPNIKYYDEQIAEGEKRLKEIEQMSLETAEIEANKDYHTAIENKKKNGDEKSAIRMRYESMLTLVENWHPPTADHAGFKEYMENQLKESIDFDTNMRYYTEPKLLTPQEWIEQETKSATWEISNGKKERAEEIERTNVRNAWIQSLRESL